MASLSYTSCLFKIRVLTICAAFFNCFRCGGSYGTFVQPLITSQKVKRAGFNSKDREFFFVRE